MKDIMWSGFIHMGGRDAQEQAPFRVLFEGEPIGIFSRVEDVMVMSDLHPRVQQQFRAREQLVRRGMPKPERID